MSAKNVFKIIFEIVIAGMLLIFAIAFFVGYESNGEKGIFNIVGSTGIDKDFSDADSTQGEEMDNMLGDSPDVASNSRICTVFETVNVKELVKVRPKGSSSFYEGTEENGFTIKLVHVEDNNGNIITTPMEVLDNTDDVNYPAYLDYDTCEVMFTVGGLYYANIEVQIENGQTVSVNVKIPVEL